MNCLSIQEALPGFAGGDLLPATATAVEEHLSGCVTCRSELRHHERVVTGLSELRAREIVPPIGLAEGLTQRADAPRAHRLLPILPVPPNELVRLVGEHRDAIASAAGATVLLAGTAWALWRAAQRGRPPEIASS